MATALTLPVASSSFAQSISATLPWTGTWSTAPMITGDGGFNNQTIRQVVHTSIGGTAVGVQFSNQYGSDPLVIGDVHIALRASGKRTVAGTDKAVTFSGQSFVTIPPGRVMMSDPVAFQVPALTDIVVSAYLPQQTPMETTGHIEGLQDVYIAPGDVSADTEFTGGVVNALGAQSYYFLTDVVVQNASTTGTVVAFGASITDGIASSPNTNGRWPDLLAARLQQAGMTIGVLNQGISGNDFFTNGAGDAGLTRFQRDVLDQYNVKWVIISDDAVNNLIGGSPPTAARLESAFAQLTQSAHAAGVKVICSTLTPFEGVSSWTADIEATRAAVNAFVATSDSGCDAVLDQAAALGDPANPPAMLGAYDSGDHLHPNQAGLQAIANSVNLGWFK
ncbi:GDSL-type esterase/lipase family protein [Caballeronia temeraria]|uniref:GDSL-type esterase/lipase family protein n=1 Tax=Caballeronia temeraria TaxID=1777137 RepID=UPI0009EDAC73|nr:GDSL-type esterase/lipase family protein [Caballeronia temeraria]